MKWIILLLNFLNDCITVDSAHFLSLKSPRIWFFSLRGAEGGGRRGGEGERRGEGRVGQGEAV